MKCECGLAYRQGDPDDEDYHAKVHAEYFSGPKIPVIRKLSPCKTGGSFPIYVVDRTCPKEIRRKLAHIAIVACRSMPGYPVGYDGSDTAEDPRLYLAADDTHIVAMVIAGLGSYFWHLAWTPDGSLSLIDLEASICRTYRIARVWTAASYRRRGLALQLIHAAANHLGYGSEGLGLELPFTQDGAYLVKRLCPDEFWGCGASFTLHESLKLKIT